MNCLAVLLRIPRSILSMPNVQKFAEVQFPGPGSPHTFWNMDPIWFPLFMSFPPGFTFRAHIPQNFPSSPLPRSVHPSITAGHLFLSWFNLCDPFFVLIPPRFPSAFREDYGFVFAFQPCFSVGLPREACVFRGFPKLGAASALSGVPSSKSFSLVPRSFVPLFLFSEPKEVP